jgi:hypothetical protein
MRCTTLADFCSTLRSYQHTLPRVSASFNQCVVDSPFCQLCSYQYALPLATTSSGVCQFQPVLSTAIHSSPSQIAFQVCTRSTHSWCVGCGMRMDVITLTVLNMSQSLKVHARDADGVLGCVWTKWDRLCAEEWCTDDSAARNDQGGCRDLISDGTYHTCPGV